MSTECNHKIKGKSFLPFVTRKTAISFLCKKCTVPQMWKNCEYYNGEAISFIVMAQLVLGEQQFLLSRDKIQNLKYVAVILGEDTT